MQLNNETLKALCPDACARPTKTRVLQFGEGNFLRAFVDRMLDDANREIGFDAGVTVIQPIARGLVDMLNEQDGLYTLILRGVVNGEVSRDTRIIRSVLGGINPYADFDAFLTAARDENVRFIVSNTTEAGIAYSETDQFDDRPQTSFPAKVTRMLWERFQAFGGKKGSGFIFLACELIDDNGQKLAECVQKTAERWQLGDEFLRFIAEENVFCSTLVDRIVTGYPRGEVEELQKEFGYEDNLIDTGEPFGLWVIECPEWVEQEFPIDKAGCPVVFTRDVKPYKMRKVRMLNGAHTSMVCAGYLAGLDTVGECMADEQLRAFMTKALYGEIMDQLPLDRADLESFAKAMYERFENPFNRHMLLSIALNSVSKYTARVLPSVKAYAAAKDGALPGCLVLGLSALIAFYRGAKFTEGGDFVGTRGADSYTVLDDAYALQAFDAMPGLDAPEALAQAALSDAKLWGEDLTQISGLAALVAAQLKTIAGEGMRAAIAAVIA